MVKNKFFIFLFSLVLAVSACTPASPAKKNTQQPVSNSDLCPCFEGISAKLDNASQARIRTISMVMGAPMTNVYVNGMPAMNGGIAQAIISSGQFSGWLYVAPGTYKIALVPHDGKIDKALFTPVDVTVVAGHRYTVAAIGQLADKDVRPLVVDETMLEAGLGASLTDNITFEINNVTGIESITEQADGKTYADNIKYGEVRAWFVPSGNVVWSTLVTVNGKTEKVWEDNGFVEPGVSFSLPWFGPYPPTNINVIGNVSQGTSELNVVDFLAGFDGRNIKIKSHLITFNTLLKLIDKAGMRDQLINSGPYFLLAPTDEAFSVLTQTDLDKLSSDPQALAALFNAHIIDGYYPFGSLSGAIYGHANRTLINRLGQKLSFIEDDLNGLPIGQNYTVGNGNRVQIIYNLLPLK